MFRAKTDQAAVVRAMAAVMVVGQAHHHSAMTVDKTMATNLALVAAAQAA
tara:strand:+ start:132 stop:281 length:150 start_codon:yes stop_codon:yes gene_type:complete